MPVAREGGVLAPVPLRIPLLFSRIICRGEVSLLSRVRVPPPLSFQRHLSACAESGRAALEAGMRSITLWSFAR